jgi:outer membrane lipoprotein carrier protein
VTAIPKVRETGFERLFLGFKGDELMEMELHDSFGNRTAIEFSDVQRNPKLPPDSFKFVPPNGADVLRD